MTRQSFHLERSEREIDLSLIFIVRKLIKFNMEALHAALTS